MINCNEPDNMVLIPGGTNSGTNPSPHEPHPDWYPSAYNISVNSFYMDKYLVSKNLWDVVSNDPETRKRGYYFSYGVKGQGKNHPVHSVNWFNAIKWLNARSELEGFEPVYYKDSEYRQIYRCSDPLDANSDCKIPSEASLLILIAEMNRAEVVEPYVKCSANGYRLPSTAQWEYAARGGLQSKRFPWGDRIDHTKANYKASVRVYEKFNNYDDGPDGAHHPKGLETGSLPYTTPVDYFPPNEYGIHDMAGNLWEWNYDWDPFELHRARVVRGGGFSSLNDNSSSAPGCRVGAIAYRPPRPDNESFAIGFRAVISPGYEYPIQKAEPFCGLEYMWPPQDYYSWLKTAYSRP